MTKSEADAFSAEVQDFIDECRANQFRKDSWLDGLPMFLFGASVATTITLITMALLK